jgi:deoxyribonuclease-1
VLSILFLLKVENGLNSSAITRNAAHAAELPAIADSYSSTKRRLFEIVVGDHPLTAYCGCRFDAAKRPDHDSCGYLPIDDDERANRVEVEHVVPASWIGQGRACWSKAICTDSKGRAFKGRKCCLAVDASFRLAYNDLHNLWPVIGEINERRQNWRFGEVAGEPRAFGRCDFELDRDARVVEPRPAIRGDIARVHIYMARTHGVWLSDELRQRLRSWHLADPPDALERARDARVGRLQGNHNPLVTGQAGF